MLYQAIILFVAAGSVSVNIRSNVVQGLRAGARLLEKAMTALLYVHNIRNAVRLRFILTTFGVSSA